MGLKQTFFRILRILFYEFLAALTLAFFLPYVAIFVGCILSSAALGAMFLQAANREIDSLIGARWLAEWEKRMRERGGAHPDYLFHTLVLVEALFLVVFGVIFSS